MVKIGVAFPDYISKDKGRKIRNFDFGEKISSKKSRDLLLLGIFIAAVVILLARLFVLQVLQGSYYRGLSDSNRTKTILIHAPRGTIFDTKGRPLVYNIPGFRETINGKTHLVDRNTANMLIAQGNKNLEIDSLREYPYKDAFAHVVGYIGQISPDDLKQDQFSNYSSGDLIGKEGIEQEYESVLVGTDGKKLVEEDSLGHEVRVLGQTDPTPGHDLNLTLDLDVQNAAYDAMKDVKKGAVIVSTPKGDVLAILSKPSFDPNLFTLGENYKPASSSAYQSLEDLLSDSQNEPFLDRAISGVYPPGSTFKLVVASAGLANKIIDESFQVDDTGILRVGSFSFSNWYFTQYGGVDGLINIVRAITRSNDIFFYKLAEKIGVDRISQTAAKFGLGKKLGIDLEGEEPGLLPTTAWKQKVIGEQWYLGDTYHYGIGQGFLLTTPLQVNAWTQAIANGGTLYGYHLLKNQSPQVLSKGILDPKSFSLIRQGMIGACSTGGVAYPLFNFTVKNSKLPVDGKNFLSVASSSADMRQVVVACKTGTAEHGDGNTLAHAWITLFAPAYNPQIVVTVLAEDSGEGSVVAGPIAKKILEEWFSKSN